MPTNTLTSLAMLKVNIDQGRDYLDYISPFILHVLVEHSPDPITDQVVSEFIRQQFGLQIPARTIQIVLKRISRRYSLKKDLGVYRIVGELPNPQLATKQSEAELHINAVCEGLRQFSQDTIRPISTQEDAVAAMLAFLSEFDISCLRAHLRGTTIPTLEGRHQADIILVSDYIQHVQQTDLQQFKSLLILVRGHMLANALLSPDLSNATKTYRKVTFYLDTPLLVRRLGIEGEHKQAATRELIALLSKLGGKVAAFSHSREELHRVLQGAADHLESPIGRGAIVWEARRRGTTRSDLLLLAESIDNKLSEAGIATEGTPSYVVNLQIDETAFEQVLDDEVSYYNPRAKEYDVNSVRSIYVIRGRTPVLSIEKARAVFVTSNSGFARAAWEYSKQYESSQDVSSVITDFTLANAAWLKSPMGAPSVPTTQLLAFSYAALNPPKDLWTKYMREIDRLEAEGTITERDHQLLRSSPLVYSELMHLTLGEDAALTSETVTETLERVSNEIRKEETEKLTSSESALRKTQEELKASRDLHREIQEHVYWQCRQRAKLFANLIASIIGLLLIGDIVASAILLLSGTFVVALISLPVIVVVGVLTLVGRWFGLSVIDIRQRIQDWRLTNLLKDREADMGIDLSEGNG